jgi:hypothetical protein
MIMCEYPKVVRLHRKPEEESEILKEARRSVEKVYLEHPGNPFIKVGVMMEGMFQQRMREKRERQGGFVLDNSHRRRGR